MATKDLDHQLTLDHTVFGSTRLGSYGGEASIAAHSLGKPLAIPIRQIHHAETPTPIDDLFHQWHKPIVSRAT